MVKEEAMVCVDELKLLGKVYDYKIIPQVLTSYIIKRIK